MPIFAKDGKGPDRAQTPDGVLTIIAAGVTIVGSIEGAGLIKVDGRVEGSISGARQVIVGRDGSVQGNVRATEAIVAGTVDGAIIGTERVEAQATASVTGDVHTRVIVIHEGAKLNGNVRMGPAMAADDGRAPVQVMR